MNTFLKRRLLPLTVIGLFIFSACSHTTPAPSYSDESSSPEKTNPIPLETTETPSPTPAMLDGEWNLSDVDISEIAPSKKLISFTFDDSPGKTIENIFAVFADFNENNPDCKASATIFFNGCRMNEQSRHQLATAHALDFELGNHTYSHYDLTTLSEEVLQEEIEKVDELLCSVDGKSHHLLRAPFGKTNDFVKSRVSVPLIDWTIDTLDWTGVSEDSIYRTIYENRFSGAIVLLHDGYDNTVQALKRLLPDLKADGYQVVSVSK